MKGWHGESMRHSLAARGIPTKIIDFAFKDNPEMNKYERGEIYRMLEGTMKFYDWSYFKNASDDERKYFYNWRIHTIFEGVTYEDFVKFVESGKKMFEPEVFYLVGSREKKTFHKDSDIDFVLRMGLTNDGYKLLHKSPDWKSMLEYHVWKIEEDHTTSGNEFTFIKNKAGNIIPVDVFLVVDMGDYE